MLSVGSLFSGGLDGIGLACENAGMRVRWQIEKEEWRRRVLALRFPRSQLFGDIQRVQATQLRPVDVMVGGFPCQDISSAGLRAGIKGSRSGLWFEFARLIGELRPAIVMLENADEITAPIRERRTGRITDCAPGFAVLASLAEMGFDAQWGIVPASAAGAPHKRDRWWCIAWNISNANRIRQRRETQTAVLRTHDYHIERHATLRQSDRGTVIHAPIASGGNDVSDALGVGLQASHSIAVGSEPTRSSVDGTSADVRHAERTRLQRRTEQGVEPSAQLFPRSRWSHEPDLGGVVFAGLPGRLERLARTQLYAAPLGLPPYPFEPPRLIDHTPDWSKRVEALGDSVCVPVAQALAEGIQEAWHWLERQG